MVNRILFTGRQHRVRRRETIANPPEGFQFLSQQSLDEMDPDYKLSNREKRLGFMTVVENILWYNHFIPKKFLKNIQGIYSPGKIIVNRFPWFLEIDNIAAIVFYRPRLLKLFKPLISFYLSSSYCRGIVCISKAAAKGMKSFFTSKKIQSKIHVVYPYVKNPNSIIKSGKKVHLLFISTKFYIKGGKEIIQALKNIDRDDFIFDFIIKKSDLHLEDLQFLESDSRVNVIEANLSKEKIREKYYSKADILVMPTYRDSFGMVYLEALSYGLILISTDQFNMPELIKHNKTGFLIKPPLYYFDKKTNLPDVRWWSNLDEYVESTEFATVTSSLLDVLNKLLSNKQKMIDMRFAAKDFFNESFNEANRKKRLQKVLKKCVE
jgi:glycosyltransferase involved in cell wall biosynthesis